MENQNSHPLSDETIGQVAKLLQLAMLTGTDIVDNLRMLKLSVNQDTNQLDPSPGYAGMFDEQVITFNKQADEKEGYETGDIIITLCCAEHDEFEREGNNLIIEKEISMYESYDCQMTIT